MEYTTHFRETLSDSMKSLYSLLFQRLMRSKTGKFVKGLLVFFSVYIINNSADSFQALIDSIQDRYRNAVLNSNVLLLHSLLVMI